MRLYSNQVSARAGEPTILSLIETVAAIGANIELGIFCGTWWHVFIGAAIVPLTLLRTDKGSLKALYMFPPIYNFCKPFVGVKSDDRPLMGQLPPAVRVPVAVPLTVPIAALGALYLFTEGLIARTAATVWTLFTIPKACIQAIPQNYWRVLLATDFATSPEFLPIPTNLPPDNLQHLEAYWFLRTSFWRETKHDWGERFLLWTAGRVVGLVIVLAASAYRLSVKGTAIVWFPLIWALMPAKPAGRNWHQHLAVEFELKRPQLVAALSALLLTLMIVKYGLWAARVSIATNAEKAREALQEWGTSSAPGLIDWTIAVVRPGAIPSWHIATLLNSLLALFFWWGSRTWLAEFKHDVAVSDERIERIVNATFFVRRLLSSYTIMWNIYIAYEVAKHLPIPEIGGPLFPWL